MRLSAQEPVPAQAGGQASAPAEATRSAPDGSGQRGERSTTRVLSGLHRVGAAVGSAWRSVLLMLLFALAGPAAAHKASDAYLEVQQAPSGLTVRWDIALRDLEVAVGLDADSDGRLTWGEIRRAWGGIERYAAPRLRVEGCPLRTAGVPRLERRSDGTYAALQMTSDCRSSDVVSITYSLLGEVDPTHRGIVKVLHGDRVIAVAVLDPGRAEPTALAGFGPTQPRSARASDPAPVAGAGSGPVFQEGAGGETESAQPGSSAHTGSAGFLAEGVRHILTGYDHVLFLLCLLLPAVARRTAQGWVPVTRLGEAVWPVLGIVTAFTIAHSITLLLAATGHVSLPAALIEPAIALTIVLAALDNLRPIFPVRRIVVAFCFGLIHGFGFAGVLAELDLPVAQFAWALLQFNLGLEAGQVAIVFVVTAILFAVRKSAAYPQVVIRGGSCVAIFFGVVWLIERTTETSLLGL